MTSRIICYTLFNINYTGVTTRSKPNSDNLEEWKKQRNTQWNFDTILQLISLRSQPEIVSYPQIIKANNFFGLSYKKETNIECWRFIFQVQHNSVFDNDDVQLGHLHNDCHNVPMILIGDEHKLLSPILDTSEKFKNIYFTYE
jgi:hypothetical protein